MIKPKKIMCLLIIYHSITIAAPHHVTCNNYNQHTIIQSIAGKDGVTLKHVAIGRKSENENRATSNACSNNLTKESLESPNDRTQPTHVWTNENSQHVTLNAQQSLPPHAQLFTEKQSPFRSHIGQKVLNLIGPFKLIAGLIGVTYGAILAHMLYTAKQIEKNDNWAFWRPEILDTMFTQGNIVIAQDLYTDIQTRYANMPDAQAFITPLVHFINDVDNQLVLLKRFIRFHEHLTYYKLSALFPTQQNVVDQATKNIHRLQLIKQFMIKSIGQYKTLNAS